jgi:hypothetical protein
LELAVMLAERAVDALETKGKELHRSGAFIEEIKMIRIAVSRVNHYVAEDKAAKGASSGRIKLFG